MFHYYQQVGKILRSHWKLFLAILVLQIITLVAFTAAGLSFEIKIIQDIQGITVPLQQANYNPQALDAGQPFINDWWQVQRSYEALRSHIWQLLGTWALLFVLLQGGLWLAAHRLVERYSFQQATRYLLWFVASAFLAFIPLALLSYFVIKNMMFSGAAPEIVITTAQWFGLGGIVMYYAGLLAWALPLKSGWKQKAKQWWVLLQKTPSVFPVIIINALLLSGGGYFFYWATVSSERASLLLLSGLLLTMLLVITRLVWIVTVYSTILSSPTLSLPSHETFLSHETRSH